jgi:hypothetical protein
MSNTAAEIISPTGAVKQPGGPLAELVATARSAHAGVLAACSNAIEHALTAGRALNLMEDNNLVRYGEWAKIYKQCDIGDRQAERYKKLARLADSNPTLKSEFAGLTIESAIKKLSPSNPPYRLRVPTRPRSPMSGPRSPTLSSRPRQPTFSSPGSGHRRRRASMLSMLLALEAGSTPSRGNGCRSLDNL